MIRTVTLLFFILLLANTAASQSTGLERVLHLKPQKIGQLTPKPESNTLILPSTFSEEWVTKEASPPKGELQTVYYICTSYKQSPSFDQKALNKERIERLVALFPEAIDNRYVTWKLIEQTACTSPQMGASFFHGFVLEYRPEVSTKDREQEIANLEAFLKNPAAGFVVENDPTISSVASALTTTRSSVVNESSSKSPVQKENRRANFPDGNFALYEYFKKNIPTGGKIALNRDDLWVSFTMTVNEEGKIENIQFAEQTKDYIQEAIAQTLNEMPNWTPALKNGSPVASTVNLELRMSFSPIVRGMYNRDGKKPNFSQAEVAAATSKVNTPDDAAQERINSAENSAVYLSMEEVITKERVAIVMDVTTSMSLHLASMNWWVANSSDSLNIVHYTFFNDGDKTEDRKKKPGKTGGIYHGNTLKELPATLMGAMRSGNGGDLVENDFEAVLAAQNQSTKADALLLIVDNFSDVRDENLLPQINKKTHVLVAGDVTVVRECYLNLAKATGGDVLVNGKRIRLENLHKGSQITIAETTYAFDGRRFRMM